MAFTLTYVSSLGDGEETVYGEFDTAAQAQDELDERLATAAPREGWSFVPTAEGVDVTNLHGWVLGHWVIRELDSAL